jgi:hypothetical protein
MADDSLQTTLRNIDVRLTRVEQILPGLATREELHAAIVPLATREELHAAIAPLATREELRVQREQDRHYRTMQFEDLRDDNRLILEHLLALSARVDALARR